VLAGAAAVVVKLNVPLTGFPFDVVNDDGKDGVIEPGKAGVELKLMFAMQALLLPLKLTVN